MSSETKSKSESSNCVKARSMLQQCLSARLLVQPKTDDKDAEFVEIGRGLIAYVCFMKGSNEELVDRMVKSVLNVRLSENEAGKLVSIMDLPGDVLIIPQATLGGSMKGKCMQYHKNIAKDEGQLLYTRFVNICRNTVQKQNQECTVQNGTYGNRQVLSTVTNGPFSHFLEFS
ncbi:D-aminoacyl-tRNA deacylase 2 [Octopus bimaculoides]|uniref:D-aminoacyl-tRNA deacylase n=1 Tax=Octopus bimaculoides TaxID=37653 RepID=A0A0L8GMP9_OCTBM|nr:D-aminoacyl-tRNA deacylase 2 [Octopus bimaculoides]|eukprot:XP_014779599.1 PREDICTED: probable D-tyrosyl-tRNA(Tyr) deacylase 2 [Octopus bimaculoides]